MKGLSRRRFLQTSAAASTLLAVPTHSVFAAGANETIRLGIVGCGWRGGQLAETFKGLKGARITGLCDPDPRRMEQVAQHAPEAERWQDMRAMFDSEDVDAVVIATCNHWHCLAAIWALEADKHVYVEKPLCHTQWEGEQLVAAVEKFQKICQVGTQQRSDPMQAEIKEFLHGDQTLGEIQWVQVNRFGVRKPIGKRDEPLEIDNQIDFNLWLGPAQEEPIYRDKLHYDWHWDWNTGSGEMGNWGVHLIDDVRNNVFLDKVDFPTRIAGAGDRYLWNDAGNTFNLHFAVMDVGIPMTIGVCNLTAGKERRRSPRINGPGSGYVVYCEGGRLEGQRGRAEAYDAENNRLKVFRGNSGGNMHQQNFLDAVRNNDPSMLNTPVEVGFHSTSWCNMANIATRFAQQSSSRDSSASPSAFDPAEVERLTQKMTEILLDHDASDAAEAFQLGPVLEYKPAELRFTGTHADSANNYLRRKDRDGFEVPELA